MRYGYGYGYQPLPVFDAGVPRAPSLSLADTTQFSGAYIVGDNVLATANTSDIDGNVTTGVQLYESGVLVGSMTQGPASTWTYTVSGVSVGAKSYTAKRLYSGGSVFSPAQAITVLDVLSPSSVTSATLVEWWDQTSVTIGVTPTAAGSSPPVITLSGTRQQPLAVFISCTLGGAVGTAKVSIYLDGGTTPVETNVLTTAGTHAISGGGGLNVVFPASGTYNVNNTWTGYCDLLVAKVSAGTNDMADAVAGNRPSITTGAEDGGGTALTFNGVAQELFNDTSSLWNNRFGGTNTTFYVLSVFRVLTLPTGSNTMTVFSAGSSGDANSRCTLSIAATPAVYACVRSDASTAVSANSNVSPSQGLNVLEWGYDGTNQFLKWNGAYVVGGDSGVSGLSNTPGAITLTRGAIACKRTTTASNFSNVRWYETVVMNHIPTDAVEYARMMRNYG